MITNYMDRAKERMPNLPMLVNVVACRVRQLNAGQRPMIKPDGLFMSNMALALKEIAEGKLSAEIVFTPVEKDAAHNLLSL
ncbi:MAG: DNA-directed RNA polymerase subunit omega [Kiritimatiellaeota bacterium]|nr:DNA-directed RNA polymerase subunit omega [Kiritimatiellota bacterium]